METFPILLEVEDSFLASALRTLRDIPGVVRLTFDVGKGDMEMHPTKPVKPMTNGSHQPRSRPKPKQRPRTSQMGDDTKYMLGILTTAGAPMNRGVLFDQVKASVAGDRKKANGVLWRARNSGLIKYLPEGMVEITGRGRVAKDELYIKGGSE